MNSAADRISRDREHLRRTLADLCAGHDHVCLIGYPDHWNAGDAAIWIGTRDILADLGIRIRYACCPWSYDPGAIAKLSPQTPILLLGGGNFGDIYFDEVNLRRRILEDWPDRKIIQLPQSIWFRDEPGLQAMADRLRQQKEFTLLVRDQQSLAVAEAAFAVPCRLCPDAAFGIRPDRFDRLNQQPVADVLQLWRIDIEGNTPPPLPGADGVLCQDWLEPAPLPRGLDAFSRWIQKPPHGELADIWQRRIAWKWLPGAWDALAWERVARGCRILKQGRVVVTNRLHAHLLALLMRIPHVVCDNQIGKLSAYWNSWPHDDDTVRFAASSTDAASMAHELVASLEN